MLPIGQGNVISFAAHLRKRRAAAERLKAMRTNYYFARWSAQMHLAWNVNFDRLEACLRTLQDEEK